MKHTAASANQSPPSLKFYWAMIFGAFSVFLIVVTTLLLVPYDEHDGEAGFDAIESPASEDAGMPDFWPEQAILTPEELRQIMLFLEVEGLAAADLLVDLQADLPVLSELPFQLLATSPHDDPFSSSALLLNQRSMQRESFFVGEEIDVGIVLVYVSRDKVFVRHGSLIEYFSLQD